jgi:UDPglucose--hexose-1-phosphate uridylyltransferase
LGKFTPQIIRDGFIAAQAFIRRIAEHDPEIQFFSVNWNYMPPAGSSMVHPHIQVNCGEIPTYQHRLQVESTLKYFLENGRSFWEDFMTAETELGERHLADAGTNFWTMGFAPQSALPDVWCIFPNHSTLLEVRDDELEPFLQGIVSTLKYFDQEGLYSFNLSVFSGRENEHFRVNARISPRLLLREIGNSDQTYFQVLHREPCCLRPPESAREKVMEVFKNSGLGPAS